MKQSDSEVDWWSLTCGGIMKYDATLWWIDKKLILGC